MSIFPQDQEYTAPVRFVVFNDIHAQFARSNHQQSGYLGATERAEWLFSQLNPGGALEDVDFVLSAGDLIHGGNLESIAAEMDGLGERLSGLKLPFYPCCGNHEIIQAEGDPDHEAAYRKVFGAEAMDYSFVVGPVEIIVISNAGTGFVTRERREARFKNLERLLSANPALPKILVCHIPLVAMRELDVYRLSFSWRSYRCLELEILDLVEKFRKQVRLVLSGHIHLTGTCQRQGITHMTTSGLASYPHDFTVLTITDKTIEVKVLTVPENLQEPSTNLHGKPHHPLDYVDREHPDPGTYLRGLPGERSFSLEI